MVKKVKAMITNFLICLMLSITIPAMVPASVSADQLLTMGTSYYVDASTGSDSHAGTSADAAWQTLDKVNSTTFMPGDRILFKAGGAWTGTLHPLGSGSAGAPITIDGYGSGNKPLIMGNGARTAIELYMQEYWTIQNLEITNDASQVAMRNGIFIHGNENSSTAEPLHGIQILNMDVHNVEGIHVYTDGDVWRSAAIQFYGIFNDVLVSGNNVHDVTVGGIFHFSEGTSDGIVVSNNIVNKTGRDGIIVAQAKNVLAEYNTVLDAGINGQGFRWIAGMFPHRSENATFQYNEVARTKKEISDGQGLDADLFNGGNIIFQYNYSHDNEGGFFLVMGDQTPYRDNKPLENIIIRYNISQNDMNGEMKVRYTDKTYIYNNDIYCLNCFVRISNDENTGLNTQGAKIWNNIFSGAGGFYQQDFLYDSNVYMGAGIIPDDPNPITADPLFVDPGKGGDFKAGVNGYQLKPESPALNAGKVIPNNGGQDYWGNPLYFGKPDIGAFEYQAEDNKPIPDGTNLLSNPGFEDPITSNIPWQLGAGFERSNEDFSSGSSSLKLTGTTSGNTSVQQAKVKTNTAYTLTFKAKSSVGGATVKVMPVTGNGLLGQAVVTASSGWKEYIVQFNSSALDSVKICILDSANGTAYFDDFSLKSKAVNPGPRNLLLNSDFEILTTGNTPWSYYYGDPNSPFSFSTEENHTVGGTQSMKMTGKRDYRGLRQDVAVKPNTDYIFSLYAKTNDNGDSSKIALFKVLDTKEKTIAQTNIGNSSDWKQFTIKVNSGSFTTLRVILQDGGISGYFDDFSVVEEVQQPISSGPDDPNIRYFGRWDKSNSSQYSSYWAGAYFRVNFTGTTVKLKLSGSDAVNFFIQLDNGAPKLYSNAKGTVDLTPAPLSNGVHSLLVAARDIKDVIRLQGLFLDSGAVTQAPYTSDKLIEFIGDSITVGYKNTNIALSSYAWKTAEQLKTEHTQIAYTGICLTDNISCYSPNAIGMSRQYFKMQTVDSPTSPDWDFTAYQPTAIVVNLGTNDSVFNVADGDFQSAYITFLQNIRAKYPAAEIFVLRTFGGYKAAPTQAAVTDRANAGDTRIHYVDTTGWLVTSDYVDGTHPTDAGQQKVADQLVPIIRTYTQPASDNLVQNPGFEFTTTGNTPWSYYYGDPNSPFSFSTEENHTAGGTQSMKMIGKRDYRGLRQDVAVKPNTDYTFSLYAKTNNNGDSTKIALFKVLDTQEKTIAQTNIGNNSDWKQFTLKVNSGSLTTLRIILQDGGISGYFDDFSAVPSDSTPPAWPAGSTLSAMNVQSTSLMLAWPSATDNVGVTQYRVYIGDRLLDTVSGSVYNYSVTGLAEYTDYTFKVIAGDNAGNWSAQGLTAIIKTADATPPITTLNLMPSQPDGQNGWYVHPVAVTLSAFDNFSGVAKTEYSLDGGSTWQAYVAPVTLSQDGKYTVNYRSTDNAGNVEPVHTISFFLDSMAPEANLTQSGHNVGDMPVDMPVAFELASTDSMSGVNEQTLVLDGVAISSGQAIPAGSLKVGAHTIAYRVSDVAGNVTEASMLFQVTSPAVVDAGVPGVPVLSSNSGYAHGLNDGNYTVTMNMWWGLNGSQFNLYENGVLVNTTSLAKTSPAAQTAVWTTTGKANGTYTYVGELINSAGKTVSQPLIVKVTDASPGKAVLSEDNWDGDGNFTVSMNLWWGTNATEYRLYENNVLIDTKSLTAASPGAQNTATAISGKAVGVYEYRCELVNTAGVTASDKLTVKVTH
ncbi:OmpL47-type beta-barrel domain-containing protein [Paenibacillus whitsoniae]|uniref:Fibronectin type-III domain-containing protein n=1 Tax=Paenibacillus whitsoniae TaxID=2496558 RepID=A0A3S0CED6_9BACL|nr:carbohydrate binding domain-containing protein [Paenibacillus whitsoniae]RTE10847.1 hypothetical protein EJQ19_06185 [Paenibacillus whitsoniae]